MSAHIRDLTATVQQNCHISDARYARDYTLCIYLLKMREYYRWEKGYGYEDPLPAKDLGDWIQEREQLWQQVESKSFLPIPIDGRQYDPFDVEGINRRLLPQGFIYSAGLGRYAKPHFFVGRLLRQESRDGLSVLISSEELARDLVSPPAANLAQTIFIRRDSIRRMLWEKIEEWRWRKQENAMARAVHCYGFAQDATSALEEMTNRETESVVLHELGEAQAEKLLGTAWQDMLAAVARTKAEMIVRAVRDHLADCLSTLPALLAHENAASLHFYFANLEGLRKKLFPELTTAYQRWVNGADLTVLMQAVEQGRERWLRTARAIIEQHQNGRRHCAAAIEDLVRGCQVICVTDFKPAPARRTE